MLQFEDATFANSVIHGGLDLQLVVRGNVLAEPIAAWLSGIGDEVAALQRSQFGPIGVHAIDYVGGCVDKSAEAFLAATQSVFAFFAIRDVAACAGDRFHLTIGTQDGDEM